MGNDWFLYDPAMRALRANIYGMCSGNFSDVWQKYGFDRDLLHGHTGEAVCQILNEVIQRMLAAGLEYYADDEINFFSHKNPNFMWGLSRNTEPLDQDTREAIVLWQLRFYRTKAEMNYKCVWIGDQTHFQGPYTDPSGKVYEGMDVSLDEFD